MIAERAALVLSALTLPWTVYFIAIYALDGWWRQKFGWSLMAIAVAVLLACVASLMWRVFGVTSPWLSVSIWAFALFGMVTRTLVLRAAQRADRRRAGRH